MNVLSAARQAAGMPAMMLLPAAAIVGLAARLWLVLEEPVPALAVDQLFDALAWNLVSRHQFTLDGIHPAAHVGPFYPLVLAWFYALVGHRPEWVPFMHIGFDLGTAWCVYRVGAALYGSQAGAWAAALFLIYPAYWTYDGRIRSESLLTFLLTAWTWSAVVCVQRQAVSRYVVAGLLAGLAMLCKPVVLVLAVLVAGLVSLGKMTPIQKAACAGAYVFACLLLVLPWTIRNYRAFHEVIPVSAGIGAGLWMGSDPLSHGSWPMTLEQESSIWESAGITPLPYAHAMYDVQNDRLLREKGWARIAGDPLAYLGLVAIRLRDFWLGNDLYLRNSAGGFADGLQADAADRGWLVAGFSLTKRVVLVPGLILLSLWSLWRERDRWRELLPLCLFPVGLTAGYIPFTVEAGRYALPVLPCLMVLAAALGARGRITQSLLNSRHTMSPRTNMAWRTN